MESKNEKIRQLEILIEQTKKNIELKNSSLEKISEDLSGSEQKIKSAKDALSEFDAAKIFTREEMRVLKTQELKRKKEQLEKERQSIGFQTNKAFELAKEIRLEANDKSEEEKSDAFRKASEIETNALNKEIKVLEDVLREKNELFENLLADKICVKSEIKNFDQKNDSKENLERLKAKIKNLRSLEDSLEKEIIDITLRIKKALKKLKLYFEI